MTQPVPPPVALVDLGGVLVRVHTSRVVAALAARAGCATAAAEAALFGGGRKRALDSGHCDFEAFRAAVEAAVGAPCCDRAWFRTAWCAIFDERPEAGALLDALTGAGCRVSLASNTDPAHWEKARTYPAVARVPEACLSFELGALKPEAAFYERAAARLGVAPGVCLLIDDREENVQGAVAAGMRAAQYPLEDASLWIARALPALLAAAPAAAPPP
jgi:FMN phosphatase YigB (HAD superfamily)